MLLQRLREIDSEEQKWDLTLSVTLNYELLTITLGRVFIASHSFYFYMRKLRPREGNPLPGITSRAETGFYMS